MSRLKQEELQLRQSKRSSDHFSSLSLSSLFVFKIFILGAPHLIDEVSYAENAIDAAAASAALLVKAMSAFQATSPCQGFDVLQLIILGFLVRFLLFAFLECVL